VKLTWRRILFFWAPLAATWIMMASEGPFLAAIIARLVDPKFNLAAHGVAFAFAILIEAPVIMLMSASTALVEDCNSYRKLLRFTQALNTISTGLLLIILIPSVYQGLMIEAIGLPAEVARLTYGALWFFLPWAGAIGYRRFLHGILIRSGRTRLVAIGTLIRLVAMTGTALTLYHGLSWPGAWVGAASLSVGVCVEAIVAHLMSRTAVAELLATQTEVGAALDYRGISTFYYPLALTSLIGLSVHPLLTFFMGRAPFPIESLAVFPVVNALGFLFRAVGLSYQEAAIALLGKHHEHAGALGRFGLVLGLATSAGLGLVAFTPMADVWFSTISGLSQDLIEVALLPARILVPLPALSVLLSYQRAVLVQERRTGPITVATAIEVVGIAVLFSWLGWGRNWVGATAAFTAFLGGRLAGNLYLLKSTVAVLRSKKHPDRQASAPLDFEHR
jgi:progressive ankylosis protein